MHTSLPSVPTLKQMNSAHTTHLLLYDQVKSYLPICALLFKKIPLCVCVSAPELSNTVENSDPEVSSIGRLQMRHCTFPLAPTSGFGQLLLVAFLFCTTRVTCPDHNIIFDMIIAIRNTLTIHISTKKAVICTVTFTNIGNVGRSRAD